MKIVQDSDLPAWALFSSSCISACVSLLMCFCLGTAFRDALVGEVVRVNLLFAFQLQDCSNSCCLSVPSHSKVSHQTPVKETKNKTKKKKKRKRTKKRNGFWFAWLELLEKLIFTVARNLKYLQLSVPVMLSDLLCMFVYIYTSYNVVNVYSISYNLVCVFL